MKKYFIRGTDYELSEINSVDHCTWFNAEADRFVLPANWVEEREVVDPEPPSYTIVLLRSKPSLGNPESYTAAQRRGLYEKDHWYTADASQYGWTWEELNRYWDIVQTIRSAA